MNDTRVKEQCNVKSWNRFVTRGFVVSPELMGALHRFKYDGHIVEIKLPDISKVEKNYKWGGMATTGSRRAADDEPIEYNIHQVDVCVDKEQTLLVDPETFNRAPVAYDLYSDEERNVFQRICEKHEELAIKYFEYWLSIVRWKVDDYRIGRVEVTGNDSGWSTYLKDKEKEHTVWIKSVIFTVPGHKLIDLESWQTIQVALDQNEISPTYISLKHDAEESMSRGDYVRSLIELAMSCEIFLRFMVLERLPKDLPDNIIVAIEEMNINQYVTKHFRSLVPNEELKKYGKLSSELTSLFSKRNSIVHMGKNVDATKHNCQRFIKVSKELHDYKDIIVNS